MTESSKQFVDADLAGARFHHVRLNGATFRMADLTGAVLRDVSLAGADIDGEIAGLVVNGVEVAPLIDAELSRRYPTHALLGATDPDGLRAAWDALQREWADTYARVAAMPDGTVDVSVDGEWSFAQTLRHLVFATDSWLGAIRGAASFHPVGVPFTEIADFVDPAELGVDIAAEPSYADVLDVRADRVAQVRDFLAGVTPDQLSAECSATLWNNSAPTTVLRCVRVILNEEWAHHRFAVRDLDAIDAG